MRKDFRERVSSLARLQSAKADFRIELRDSTRVGLLRGPKRHIQPEELTVRVVNLRPCRQPMQDFGELGRGSDRVHLLPSFVFKSLKGYSTMCRMGKPTGDSISLLRCRPESIIAACILECSPPAPLEAVFAWDKVPATQLA
jgi:hypothetical protein